MKTKILALVIAVVAVSLSGCAETQERLKDTNRDYDLYGNFSTGMIGAEARWYPAGQPGAGRPSVGVKLEGQVPMNQVKGMPALEEPDFKSPVATEKGVWFK